jgi:uncharacterized RDD family membrane protein YckC
MTTDIEQIDWTHWVYRLIALIIDSIIAGIIAGIIYSLLIVPFLFTSVVFGIGFFSAPWWAGTFLYPLIFGIVLVLYSTLLETSWDGDTVGKRLLGLQVQAGNSSKLPFDKVFIRNISKIYWIFLFIDWLLGILTPGNKRQKYSDRLAGTIVVQIRQAFASTPPPPPPPT